MSLKTKGVTFTVVMLLALAGLFSGIFVGQHIHFKKKIDISKFNGTYLEHPRPVNKFNLTGIDNNTFDNNSLQGKWTLIFLVSLIVAMFVQQLWLNWLRCTVSLKKKELRIYLG